MRVYGCLTKFEFPAVDPPETTWYHYDVIDYKGTRFLLVGRKFNAMSRGKLEMNTTIVASNSEGKATIPLMGYMPPPEITYRYPSIDRTSAPLQSQKVLQKNVWYTDIYPPEGFGYVSWYRQRYDTLALTAGPHGQPGARVRAFGDENLRRDEYNWQGMKYTHDSVVDLDDGVLVTASLYVHREWIENSPGSLGCVTDPSECAVATEFAVDLGLGPSGSRDHLFRIHIGFDNRDESWRDYGPFVYMYLDGPLTQQFGVQGVWPYSSLGTLLAFGFPGKNPKKVDQWINTVKYDDWNDFAFSIRRISGDSGVIGGTRRGCLETAKIEWYVDYPT